MREIDRAVRQGLADIQISSISQIDEYPKLSPLDKPNAVRVVQEPNAAPVIAPIPAATTGLSEAVSLVVGAFKLELSRRRQRLNITRTDTLETAFIRIAERECGGEVEFQPKEGAIWRCGQWGLSVQLPVEVDDALLVVEFEEAGVMLRMDR